MVRSVQIDCFLLFFECISAEKKKPLLNLPIKKKSRKLKVKKKKHFVFFFLAPFLFFKIYTPNFEKFFPSFLFTLEKCDMQNRSNSNQTWKFLLLGRKEKKRRQKLLKRFFVYNFLVSLVLYFWWLVWESCYRRGEEGEANFCSFVWLQSVFIRNALLFFFFFSPIYHLFIIWKEKTFFAFYLWKILFEKKWRKKIAEFFFSFFSCKLNGVFFFRWQNG